LTRWWQKVTAKEVFAARLAEINQKMSAINYTFGITHDNYIKKQLMFQYRCLVDVKEINEKLLNFVSENK
jgi:hypothetical protein